jgi:hypothetical protein
MWRERLRATPNRSLRLIAYARECDNPIGPSVPQFRRRLRAPARLAAKRNADSDYTSTCKDGNRYHVFANAHGRVGTGALKALEILKLGPGTIHGQIGASETPPGELLRERSIPDLL